MTKLRNPITAVHQKAVQSAIGAALDAHAQGRPWEELSRARDWLERIEDGVGVERIQASWGTTSDGREAARRTEVLRLAVATAVAGEVAAHLQEHAGDARSVASLLLAFADTWGLE